MELRRKIIYVYIYIYIQKRVGCGCKRLAGLDRWPEKCQSDYRGGTPIPSCPLGLAPDRWPEQCESDCRGGTPYRLVHWHCSQTAGPSGRNVPGQTEKALGAQTLAQNVHFDRRIISYMNISTIWGNGQGMPVDKTRRRQVPRP